MSAKIHFRDYNPKQTLLFSQRLDKDIAGNDPVRVVDTVIDNLKLETSTNFIRSVAAVHTIRR